MIQNDDGKVLYSKYSDFSYLFVDSRHWVFMPDEESRLVEHIVLAMLTF